MIKYTRSISYYIHKNSLINYHFYLENIGKVLAILKGDNEDSTTNAESISKALS